MIQSRAMLHMWGRFNKSLLLLHNNPDILASQKLIKISPIQCLYRVINRSQLHKAQSCRLSAPGPEKWFEEYPVKSTQILLGCHLILNQKKIRWAPWKKNLDRCYPRKISWFFKLDISKIKWRWIRGKVTYYLQYL